MKMRFLHSILCIFVVGSVLAVSGSDKPEQSSPGPQAGTSNTNALPAAPSGAGSGVQGSQTPSQGKPGVTGSVGEGQEAVTGSTEENTRTQSQGPKGEPGSGGETTRTESHGEPSVPGSDGKSQIPQEKGPGAPALGQSGSSSGLPGKPEAAGSDLPTSTTSEQSANTEVQNGGHPQPPTDKAALQGSKADQDLPKDQLTGSTSAPGEENNGKGAQLPGKNVVAGVKEDEEEKEEEKEKGDEEEDGEEKRPSGPDAPKVDGLNHGKTAKEPELKAPQEDVKSTKPAGAEQRTESHVSASEPAVVTPGKDGESVSHPKGATSAVPEPSATLNQKPDAPEVVQKPETGKDNQVQPSAGETDSEDEEEEEEEEEDDDDGAHSGEYNASDDIPEEMLGSFSRARNGSPNGETRRNAVRPGSERTHGRGKRQVGSGSSSSGTQTEANPAGTQQPGDGAKGANPQGPESGSSNSQAPQQPTLETLVKTGSISEKQEIVTAFLKKDLAEGPLRKIFNYKDDSKTLETCRHLTQRKPKVCKAGNIKTEAPSANVDLNRLVGEYLAHSVCTVEAALNQMYHSVHQGEYISNEIHAALKILSNVMRMNTTMRERYGDSEHILENLLQLFHAAEKALVSQSVQTVLYNRWALLDSVLCAVASGESNEVLDKINMDASNSSATAVVNLERFINSSTEVFVKAYKPFAELLRVIENGVLIKALELNKNEFREQAERVVQTITERHVSGISPATLTPLAQIPHSGMNTADIQRIAGQMGNSVSLVQRGQDVTQAGAVSPTTALRTAVLSLNIFKVSGNHIAPEIDESAVRTMVRSALLSFSEEEMVSKLIVAPQAALRVIYETIKLLVPIPAENGATAVTSDDANSRIKEIERLMDENFRQVNQAVSRSLSTSGRANPPETALIQTAVNHLGGAAPAKTDLQTRATFTVDSRQDGANLEDNTNKYIEEQQFQKNMDNLVHIKSYSSATLAGTVGILALALVVIF